MRRLKMQWSWMLAVLTIAVTSLGSELPAEAQAGGIYPRVPKSGENNLWYVSNKSDTVFVFVHGLFSDSRGAWQASSGVFWPNLITNDERLDQPSIYLGGFYTSLSAGQYSIRDAANELYRRLTLDNVFKKQEILFIAHSLGGIVVRQLLVRKREELQDKKVGLMLMASPSTGSRDATRLRWLSETAKNRMGEELQWDHPLLEDLDREFTDLVYKKRIPCLRGVEAVENHLLFKWLGLFRNEVLVEFSSAGRYFGDPQRLPDTDHSTAVKPDSYNHPAHQLLRHFYQTDFSEPCEPKGAAPTTEPPTIDCIGTVQEINVNESISVTGFSDGTLFTGLQVTDSTVTLAVKEHAQDGVPARHELEFDKINFVAIRNLRGEEKVAKIVPFKLSPEIGRALLCIEPPAYAAGGSSAEGAGADSGPSLINATGILHRIRLIPECEFKGRGTWVSILDDASIQIALDSTHESGDRGAGLSVRRDRDDSQITKLDYLAADQQEIVVFEPRIFIEISDVEKCSVRYKLSQTPGGSS